MFDKNTYTHKGTKQTAFQYSLFGISVCVGVMLTLVQFAFSFMCIHVRVYHASGLLQNVYERIFLKMEKSVDEVRGEYISSTISNNQRSRSGSTNHVFYVFGNLLMPFALKNL